MYGLSFLIFAVTTLLNIPSAICLYEDLAVSSGLMDGKSPLEMELPGPLNLLKKPALKFIKGTVVEKLLRDHNILRDGMA